MANLVNLESVTVVVGHRLLLDRISLGVQTGDRIGVLGLNGSGKSTLLSVLAGARKPDSGRVAVSRGAAVAAVAQSSAAPVGLTVREVALQAFEGLAGDHHWASDTAVRAVLDGLGLNSLGLDSPVDRLSGGERRRVALAAALVTDAELLVLDEPTNHLDIEAVAWLAEHLVARRGALIVVTHDRWFLDAVATNTWEVVDSTVYVREGGYSDWVFARAERLRLATAAEDRRRNLARKELAWLRRGAPARTSKPRYRIEAAEALIADVPPPRDTVELHSFARHRLGRDVLDLEDVTVARGGRTLLNRVTWRLGAGDRIGLVGVNGSGKTSLLRVLVGEDPPDSGRVKRGSTVRIGYLSQEVTELPGDLRLLEAVTDVARVVNLGGKDVTAGQLCERFGFGNTQQWTFVSELSGGERRRLQLLRILMAEPNVLVLDEPTNDLDTDTLQSLEDVLDTWPGTLVVVSHDRYLIERICDDVIALLGDGSLLQMVGGVTEYLQRRAHARVAEQAEAVGGRGAGPSASAALSAPNAGARSALDAGQARLLRKQLLALERRLESLSRKEADLHARLAATGNDYGLAAALDRELSDVRDARDIAEQEWLEVAESLES